MKKVGVLGNGQLAQLLTHAAYPLALQTICITATDPAEILKLVKECEVLTLENENIEIDLLNTLSQECLIYPSPETIKLSQDRLLEKSLFQSLDIPTPTFFSITSLPELETALTKTGLPAILKTRRFGYDGKGQVIIRQIEEASQAWQTIAEAPAILEAFVPFDFEVSLIAARNPSDEIIFYPLIKNTHEAGILRISECPYLNVHLQELAEKYMHRLFDHLNYVGVLAFEFFVQDQSLITNEIAPRVHNSGHLTIEGFNVSQFESHLRAILDLPLIKPILYSKTRMHNIIGSFPALARADYQHAHIYDYGKSERPGRKLGHMTLFNIQS